MDSQRLKDAYYKLESLDERLTFKLRSRSGGGMVRPSVEQLEERMRDLSEYTLELKDVLRELILAFARKPGAGAGPPAAE